MNGISKMTQTTPKMLNMKCAAAARFACMFATKAARLAVMVVPMFSPSTIAAAKIEWNPAVICHYQMLKPLPHLMTVQ
jgi:hypothetical protein